MHKDVKRSLIMWPGTATAIVALISGYSILHDYSQNIGPDTDSLAIATQPSFEFETPSLTNVAISSRGEHGRRAMELPERVADVLGVLPSGNENRTDTLPGHTFEDYQIEGMIVPPWGIVINATPTTNRAPSNAANIAEVVQPTPAILAEPKRQPIDLVEMLDGIVELNAPQLGLPESNRALAKPEFPIKAAVPTSPVIQAPRSPVVSLDIHDRLALNEPGLATRRPKDNRRPAFGTTGWPAPTLLNRQLKDLAIMVANVPLDHESDAQVSNADIDRWIVETTNTLSELQSLEHLGDDDAAGHIGRLRRLAREGTSLADTVGQRSIQVAWLQAAHAVSRRVAIWKAVWKLANVDAEPEPRSRFAIAMKPDMYGSVHAAIDKVRAILPETGDSVGWDRYLLLEPIDQAASSADRERRREIATQFVARLERRNLHPKHRQWLEQQASIQMLRSALGPWARGVVDYSELLSQIERQESSANDKAALAIAEVIDKLRFAEIVEAEDLADTIDTYYRNANVRVAISQAMLQRLVPKVPTQSMPVRTRVQGSQVRGKSDIDSELKISLVPAADRWKMQLKTVGQVRTNATGVRGPVSVRTRGRSHFTATTPIEVTPHGVELGESEAKVWGKTKLRGIQTEYDGWPFVGTIVRTAAARRFDSMSSQSSQLTNRKIAAEIESKVDLQFHERVGQATEQLGQAVLGPLGRMRLDPLVTDMMTSEDRLVARYRLASSSQLAAFTPRPRALANSLASVQVHQSAINNVLRHLIPTDQPTSIREAISDAIEMFGERDIAVPDDIPDDVTVQFARSNPITVEFKEDSMWLTMRIARLRRDRLNLTKFIVQAEFRPQVDGATAKLQREGHLRISGPGMSMRERLPIRAIFNKVLASSRPFPLTVKAMSEHPAMESLAIGQLVARDGWLALAITEANSTRLASVPAGDNNSVRTTADQR